MMSWRYIRCLKTTFVSGTKARRAQVEELNKVDDLDSLILVGTGSLLGEGFDFPRLDTLFMATPVSGENVVEQYVVIDNEIVWYGSVNLLSKEDAEDNLMRVCSKDIAAELLEMTFGSEEELQEW